MDCSYTNQRRAMMGCPPKSSPFMTNPNFTADNCNYSDMPPMMPAHQMPGCTSQAMPIQKMPGCASQIMPAHQMPECASQTMPANRPLRHIPAPDCTDTMPGCMENYPIGMGYVPWQQWKQTYALDRALQRGTIFPELDLPFVMGRCR